MKNIAPISAATWEAVGSKGYPILAATLQPINDSTIPYTNIAPISTVSVIHSVNMWSEVEQWKQLSQNLKFLKY